MAVRALLSLAGLIAAVAVPPGASAGSAPSAKAEPAAASPNAANSSAKDDDDTDDEVQQQNCKSSPLPLARKHRGLQRSLDRRLRAAGFGKYLDKKQLAVSLVDLSTGKRLYYAGINDDEMMYAASLPKIAILLSVIAQVNDGVLEWSHEFDQRLQNMIVASSNEDASWAANLVGLKAIEETMRDPRYCFYDDEHGGLWVGRSYGKGHGENRDPMKSLSHAATARQAARFFTMLDAGMLVSKHWSFRMLGLMSPPQHHHKFVGGLNGVPGVVFLARKSGTWRNWHSDVALIQHHGRRYVAVGVSETKHGEKILREMIRVLDDLVMDGAHRKRKNSRVQASLLR